MKKILVIARHEFVTVVTRKAFLIATLAFPLLIMLVGAIRATGNESGSMPGSAIGVIDQTGVIDLRLFELIVQSRPSAGPGDPSADQRHSVGLYPDLDAALAALKSRSVDVVYLVPSDYGSGGKIRLYARERASRRSFSSDTTMFQDLLRASLLRSRAGPEATNQLFTPMEVEELAVTETGGVVPAREEQGKLNALTAPLSLAMMLAVWIILSSRFMLTATLEENSNRAMEVILSSVRPSDLIWGKVIGLSGVALTQLAVYVAMVGLVRSSLWTFLNLPVGTLFICFGFCVAGYLFFAGLMTAAGATGWGRSATLITLTVWIPLVAWESLSGDPNGALARVLSFVPLTSTMTMTLRLSVATVPPLETVASLAALVLSAFLTVAGGAKIFRTNILMTGQRISLQHMIRSLREA